MTLKSCALIVLVTAFIAQNPPRDPAQSPPQWTGTGRISGVVVAADNGAPVKRANVTIVAYGGIPGRVPPGVGRGTGVVGGIVGGGSTITITSELAQAGGPIRQAQVTDESGRFEFTGLPAGRYNLAVMPQGGFVRNQRSQSIVLADNGSATVSLKLERTGAIAGRITDESGEPMPRVRVSALRRQSVGGFPSSGGSAMTDDLGQFRIFDLPPGEYFVSGTGMEMRSFEAETPALGYGPTFYPGATSIEGALPVAVRSGQDAASVMFSLVRVPMGKITGTVRDSAGQLIANAGRGAMGVAVALTARREEGMSSSRGAPMRPDGTFVIAGIPPGEYYLTASASPGGGPDAPREGTFTVVTVNGDAQHVDLRLNAGATVSGRVQFEGDPEGLLPMRGAGPGGALRTSIAARNVPGGPPMQFGGQRPVTVEGDGTFELTGLRGLLLLTANAMPRAIVKSIMHGGDDLSRQPVDFTGTERLKDVVVVMTTEAGRIEGLVTTAKGTPAPEATVLVYADEPDTWFLGSPHVFITRSMPDDPALAERRAPPGMPQRGPGRFVSPWVLPGKYYVVALESDAGGFSGAPQGREALEELRKMATTVTVVAGQTGQIQVRVQQP